MSKTGIFAFNQVAWFSARDSSAQWWNATMTYNSESDLWTVIVPLQPNNITTDFYIIAYDNAGNLANADN